MSNSPTKALESYLKLRNKFIAVSEGQYRPSLTPVNMQTVKHHYIPKHFIDGFLNTDGLLWVYHKQKDRIIQNPQGSRGLFFEVHRNSVKLDNEVSIPLFEHYYSVMDNLSPSVIKLLRGEWTLDNTLLAELYEHLNIFLIDLYWRNVNTDTMYDSMFESSPIYVNDNSMLLTTKQVRELKSTPEVKQQIRINMSHESLRAMAWYMENHKLVQGVITFDSAQLCIGDMPYVMSKQAGSHIELASVPLVMPISSNKLYLRNIKPTLKWRLRDRALLNALIIDQSTNYIACADRQTLELAIQAYHYAADNSLLIPFKNMLFNKK